MSRRALQPRANICQLCDHIQAKRLPTKQYFRAQRAVYPTRIFSTGRRICAPNPPVEIKSNAATLGGHKNIPVGALNQVRKSNGKHTTDAELGAVLEKVKQACDGLLSSKGIPTERETFNVLGQCEGMARLLVLDHSSSSKTAKDGAASALLSLDKLEPERIPHTNLPQNIKRMVDELSRLAYSIVQFPPVFITPKVLEVYVSTQATLVRPETLAEVLLLYANKTLPQEGSSPIQYRKQNPNKVNNAIPSAVANRALQTAIHAKDMVAAMGIIEISYCTKAYRRAKFVRQGLLPATGLAVAPVAAYALASQLSVLQTTMDSAMATQVAFAGILAYLGFTATVGVVAVTTANDQMDRVTWAQGVPLIERWIREEERAAIDKVAGAWGFREAWRRGEEEGEDWDDLREWIGRRSMMLDRVELMEGME